MDAAALVGVTQNGKTGAQLWDGPRRRVFFRRSVTSERVGLSKPKQMGCLGVLTGARGQGRGERIR